MAVILNVYDKIIDSISKLKTDFKNSLQVLVPIGIGAVLGILLFAKIIDYTLVAYPVATNFVFLGLIIGSNPMIFQKTREYTPSNIGYIAFGICICIMLYMKFANPQESVEIIKTLNIQNFIKIFLCTIVASGAMIVPGISGSFIMLVLGIYNTILTAVSTFNIPILMVVGVGSVCGILIFAKIIDKLFEKYPFITYMGILGLMNGSIIIILPKITLNLELFVGILLMCLSAYVAYAFSKKDGGSENG